jgi:hypothetical protein
VPVEFEKEPKTSQRGLVIPMLEFLHHSIIQVSRRILHVGGDGDGEIERKQHCNHSWEHDHQYLLHNASVLLGKISAPSCRDVAIAVPPCDYPPWLKPKRIQELGFIRCQELPSDYLN